MVTANCGHNFLRNGLDMDERYRKRIGDMRSWKDLNELENNFKRNNAWSEEVGTVFKSRSTQLGIEYILAETGLRCTVNSGHSCFKPPVAVC